MKIILYKIINICFQKMNYKLILLLLFIFLLIVIGIIARHVEYKNEDDYIYLDLNSTWFNETILV